MQTKHTTDTTPQVSEAAGVMSPVAQAEKPKRARSRSAATPRRTAGKKTEAAASNGAPHASADPGEIAHLAHALWEARGGQGGSPEDDWFRAERELRARGAATGKA
ncbi:MAG: DUF2934 domain-containing protein [Bryobacterales bacterium]|nr:DUF2934 domain-containing protein [Bryobacterales bacterium]